jgi:hypothetical protein
LTKPAAAVTQPELGSRKPTKAIVRALPDADAFQILGNLYTVRPNVVDRGCTNSAWNECQIFQAIPSVPEASENERMPWFARGGFDADSVAIIVHAPDTSEV